MTIEVNLPQFGMGMTEGTVLRWFKGEGEAVVEGEDIAEVEAEKTTVTVIAPETGTLFKILVRPEETVPVFTVLALIDLGAEVTGAEVTGAEVMDSDMMDSEADAE